jgi:hypothetical protein
MAAPIRPASSKAYGREKWQFVPTLSSTTAPSLAQVNAVTALDISCYLFESSARPTGSTNLVDRERRVCDTQTFQQIGTTSFAGGEMIAALDPQAVAASDGKKAWEKFPEGTTGYLVRRLGIDVNTDFAVGQFVDVFPVEFGVPVPGTTGDGESRENSFTSTFAITGPPSFVKALVA